VDFHPEFHSRRSNVRSTGGMVATSQPLAALAGLRALEAGGTAADAAVTAAAALTVVEPVSNGPGGDLFALVFDAKTGRVSGLNGSGRAPAGASLPEMRRLMYRKMPGYTGHTVTVPGVVRGWADLLADHGTFGLDRALAPAIGFARQGFPVTEWIAATWATQESKLLRAPGWQSGDFSNGPAQESGKELLHHGRAPRAGEVVRLTTLGATLERIADEGPDALYVGEIAAKMAAHVKRYGGWLSEEDLAAHRTERVEPISVSYRGVQLNECPPNGQGLAALIAAGIADGFDLEGLDPAARTHLLIEAMRVGFADALAHVADPEHSAAPVGELLSPEYLERRRAAIDPARTAAFPRPGPAFAGDDTVYVSVVDGAGNAVSLIQSNYMGTGTGLVVPGTGISLQNRGAGFLLERDHPNALGPGKRPYHTIIPALTTRDGALHACFGVMGGFMQPQGHLQVLSNLLDLEMDPQEALDAPRWQIVGPGRTPDPAGPVVVEDGIAGAVREALIRRGHRLKVVSGFKRLVMGGGQVILRDEGSGVLTGGSDCRKDGCAVGF
jgi:gamma-glutamyltranspeptidase / glutathione hydrolase